MKKNKESDSLINGLHEVKLTDELIKKLVEEKKWHSVESLKQMADMGAKWNLSRNSIILSF
jgi:hypothetical protein